MGKIFYNTFKDEHIGTISVASQNDKLCYIGLNEILDYTFDAKSNAQIICELKEYFAGKRTKFTVGMIFLNGSDFQKRVWQALLKIPHGQVVSYKDLAEMVGCPNGFRAVGNANGKNPLPIVVPCHRVIGADGRLGGYSGGLAIKRHLLNLENVKIKD
jgi:O-6-methylguanine DNA methyltransferase